MRICFQFMDADFVRLFICFQERRSLDFATFKTVWVDGEYSELHTVVSAFAPSAIGPGYQIIYVHLLSYLSQRRPVAWKVGAVCALSTLFILRGTGAFKCVGTLLFATGLESRTYPNRAL